MQRSAKIMRKERDLKKFRSVWIKDATNTEIETLSDSFSIRWTHLIEKESLSVKGSEHVPIE